MKQFPPYLLPAIEEGNMPAKHPAKKSGARKSATTRSKRPTKNKMEKVMNEYKHGELKSGKGGKGGKVKNPKQAIAIGLSESRAAGGNVPPRKGAKKSSAKKTGAKRTSRKSTTKKSAAKR
jgi:hypothetical protein